MILVILLILSQVYSVVTGWIFDPCCDGPCCNSNGQTNTTGVNESGGIITITVLTVILLVGILLWCYKRGYCKKQDGELQHINSVC